MKKILAFISAVWTFWTANKTQIEALANAAAIIFGAFAKSEPRAIATVQELRADVLRLNLWRPHTFDTTPDTVLFKIWNGYGPDDWPEWLRVALTWVFRNFQAVASVHDFQYENSTGTREGWAVTQSYWRANCSIMLAARYPLRCVALWPLRAIAWLKLRAAYRALELGSFPVWVAASKRVR